MKYIALIVCFLASIIVWNINFNDLEEKYNGKTVKYERQENFKIVLKDGNYVETYLLYNDSVNNFVKTDIKYDLNLLFKDLTTNDILDLNKKDKFESFLDSAVFRGYIPNPLLQYNFKVNLNINK